MITSLINITGLSLLLLTAQDTRINTLSAEAVFDRGALAGIMACEGMMKENWDFETTMKFLEQKKKEAIHAQPIEPKAAQTKP